MRLFFSGDPHGQFRYLIESTARSADAVIFLGDMEPGRPLHEELEPLIERQVPIFWIPGNHDADSDELWIRVWGSELADQNIQGRVVDLADGTRVAGLGGVFRESVWHPSAAAVRGGEPAFRTRSAHAKATPRQDRWGGTGPHRRHWGSIYPAEVDRLADQRAEILVTHEAPGYHPHGFELLDDLARQLGVKVAIHGHHHDALDSSARWAAQGFQSHGVGLRGLSLLDTSTWQWSVIQPGELDNARAHRQRRLPHSPVLSRGTQASSEAKQLRVICRLVGLSWRTSCSQALGSGLVRRISPSSLFAASAMTTARLQSRSGSTVPAMSSRSSFRCALLRNDYRTSHASCAEDQAPKSMPMADSRLFVRSTPQELI